jgi:hypothetical protein
METARFRWWLSDPVAWGIFAGGIVTMLAAASVIIVFENVEAIYERRGILQVLFFAASAFALAGPVAATIEQSFRNRALMNSGKPRKAIGLEDL